MIPFYFCNIVGDGTGVSSKGYVLDGRVFDFVLSDPVLDIHILLILDLGMFIEPS